LHVLNTPPAFVLSQNQTLRKKFGWRIPLIKKEPYSKLTLAKIPCGRSAVSARLSTKARSAQFNLSTIPQKAAHHGKCTLGADSFGARTKGV
jgi:hypothetical protein